MSPNSPTAAPTVVDARFAGGPLVVDTEPLAHDPERSVVTIQGPGFIVALFPHEAAALAEALTTAALHVAPGRG